jgi:N-acetylglutamate synthase-like GNAT family acetyltransferase
METLSHSIRVAELSDIGRLVELVNSAYRGDSSKKGWTTEAHILGGQRIDSEMLREMIQDRSSILLVLEDRIESSPQRRIEACVHLKKVDAQSAYLGLLTVNPEIQNKGYGRLLLKFSENWISKNWKLPRIIMTVISTRSELIAWYERRGYSYSGKSSDFPMNDPRFGIPLVSDIKFVELHKFLQAPHS